MKVQYFSMACTCSEYMYFEFQIISVGTWQLLIMYTDTNIGSIEEQTSDVRIETTAADTLRLSNVGDWEPWQQSSSNNCGAEVEVAVALSIW